MYLALGVHRLPYYMGRAGEMALLRVASKSNNRVNAKTRLAHDSVLAIAEQISDPNRVITSITISTDALLGNWAKGL